MRLAEAYERLSLSLDFEGGQWDQGDLHPNETQPRGIGTTFHTLIELCLDMAEVGKDLAAVTQRPVQFVFVCLNDSMQRWVADILKSIDRDLDLGLNRRLDRIVYGIPGSKNFDKLAGQMVYSWAVFCDHSVKDDHCPRIESPLFQTRSLSFHDGMWAAFSRDGELLGHITDAKAKRIMDAATAPITYATRKDVPSVTYPAWGEPEIMRMVRLRKAFKR